jgi:F-type H+-transporting ATPase subunit c
VRRSLIFIFMAVLAMPGIALAAEQAGAADSGWLKPFAAIAAGIGMALASGLCAIGQGRAVASAVDAIARQPGAANRIQTAMIIGLALIESLALYVLVMGVLLLFVKWPA